MPEESKEMFYGQGRSIKRSFWWPVGRIRDTESALRAAGHGAMTAWLYAVLNVYVWAILFYRGGYVGGPDMTETIAYVWASVHALFVIVGLGYLGLRISKGGWMSAVVVACYAANELHNDITTSNWLLPGIVLMLFAIDGVRGTLRYRQLAKLPAGQSSQNEA